MKLKIRFKINKYLKIKNKERERKWEKKEIKRKCHFQKIN